MQDLSSANGGALVLWVPHPAWEPHSSAVSSHWTPSHFPISQGQAPQPPLSTQVSCPMLSNPVACMRGTWDTAFLVFFCHLALACSTGSLCTCDSAAQMSQMFANPSSILPYPEPGALSSTSPRLVRLTLITATLQFWSKGALALIVGPPSSKDLKKDVSLRKE